MKTSLRCLINVLIGLTLTTTVWSQSHSGSCPSDLQIKAGTTTVIDCALQQDFLAYQWTSMDPTWLSYLSDVTIASPRFHAPVEIESPYHIAYRRLVLNPDGGVIKRELISITVYDSNESVSSDSTEKRWRENTEPIEVTFDIPNEAPFLQCLPRVTVNSGEMVEIACTGLHSSGGLLGYRIESDWPPYSTTQLLGAGAFDYFVRAPVIHEPASVHTLEIFAKIPEIDQEVLAHVEVHVVNTAPILTCEDLIVAGDMEVDLPCSVISDHAVQLQLLGQQGIYSHWPKLSIPSVTRDTSYSVTVRAFSDNQVVEESFVVSVLSASKPAKFGLECSPLHQEVYEGTSAFEIKCEVTDPPSTELSWTWAAEGDTPLELLELRRVDGTVGTATFHVPENVTEDTFYEYTVTVTHNDVSHRVSIAITILEKPNITVVCEDTQARTGDPPLRLTCEASNSKDLPLTYQWRWTPPTLLSEADTGTPLFAVPADQPELVQEYEYNVTATADLADPAPTPTKLVITVLKNLGPLSLTCESPIEVYEGMPDVFLNCSVPPLLSGDVVWSWDLVNGTEDLLVQGSNGAPPIFRTPIEVVDKTTWTYLIRVDAPPHYEISESQEVEITVLPRPVLSLECPEEIEVTVGQSPQPIMCEVSNDQDLDLTYTWRWMPATRLSNTDTGSPLFDVPIRQRVYSQVFSYTVMVWSDLADPVEATIQVTVLNPSTVPSALTEVTTSTLNFGVVGAQGQIVMDPVSEQISGSVYEGVPTTGRLILRSQDSVTVFLEQLSSVRLNHLTKDTILILEPDWAYSKSCIQFLANSQAGHIVQSHLSPNDCHVIRVGGAVFLDDAIPGTYSGDVAVVLTLNEVEEIYTIPVTLTVEKVRQAIELGPSGVQITSVSHTDLYGDERIRIWPRVATFNPETRRHVFELHNPSLHPMEIMVTQAYGYREDRNGESILVTDQGIGDLTSVLSMHPEVVILLPGETNQIQVVLNESLENQGYAGIFNFTITSRKYVSQDQRSGLASPAKITFEIPAIYTPDIRSEPIQAYLEAQTNESLTVVFETGMIPFYGQVLVFDNEDREVGQSDLLVVTRSQIQITLEDGSQGPFSLKLKPYSSTQFPLIDVHLQE